MCSLDLPVALRVVARGVCDLDACHPAEVAEKLTGELSPAVGVDGFRVSESAEDFPVQCPDRLLCSGSLQRNGFYPFAEAIPTSEDPRGT